MLCLVQKENYNQYLIYLTRLVKSFMFKGPGHLQLLFYIVDNKIFLRLHTAVGAGGPIIRPFSDYKLLT